MVCLGDMLSVACINGGRVPRRRPYSSVLRLVSNNSDEDFDREVYRLAHLRPLVSKAASQRSQAMVDDFTNFSSDDEFEYSSGVLVDSVFDVLCDDFSDEDFQYEEVDARYYRVSKRTLKAGGLVGLEGGKLGTAYYRA
uniref:Uncharacterized protein n=1 Tax=Oryza rufipogon TaxID=4529 RepID=A0A0E0PAQ3_ORYRU